MKIAILTQPLFTNYGGILQAYALQSVLCDMGHEVVVIRRDPLQLSLRFPNNLVIELKYYLRRLLRGYSDSLSSRQIRLVSKETSRFIKKNISLTKSIYTERQLKSFFAKHYFDVYLVGSDQVWRPNMSPNIYDYYLGFLDNDTPIRIAYAASFGVDHWEYSDEQTRICRALAQKFKAISVREKSGIDLCQRYLGVQASHVLDPTLLLDRAHYEQVVKSENETQIEGELFCYVLNMTDYAKSCISSIKATTGYIDYYCMPDSVRNTSRLDKINPKSVFPSVTRWLRSFIDAKMVFTDSFHGTAFSIIFNKPFWVVGNKLRGLSRIDSILELFGLRDRYIESVSLDNINWNKTIEWGAVNRRKQQLQSFSIGFLKNNLKYE